MDFLELAKARYSCRSLCGKPVEQEKIDLILEAAKVAPTAKNNHPVKVWVLSSEEAQKNVAEVTQCIFGAKLFFVIGGKKDEAWVRPFDGANFAHVDASIVATHMLMEIQQLGLGTTWVGFFDAPKLQTIYPQMKDYDLVAMFPVGYPAEDAKPAPRHTEYRPDGELVEVL